MKKSENNEFGTSLENLKIMNVLVQKWQIFLLPDTQISKFSPLAPLALAKVMRLRHSVISHVFGAYQTATVIVIDKVQESRCKTFANDAYR